MAQETISSAILIIAAIVATVALINAVYPSLSSATDSVGSVSGTASDRVRTDLKITASSHPNATALAVWAKNIGGTEVPAGKIPYTDVYFGDGERTIRIAPDGEEPCHWSYVLDDVDGDGSWGPGETLQVLISDAGAAYLTAGSHRVKLVLYNSAAVEETVTL